MPKGLIEAGKVFAKRNVSKLKAMQAQIAEMLKEVEDDGQSVDAKESTYLMEETLRLVDSHDSLRMRLAQTVRVKVRTESGNPEAWPYVRDVFPDSVVYEDAGKLYQAPYALAGESVSVGDAVSVELAYVAKETPVTESGDTLDVEFVPLVEKAVRNDGTIALKLIDPGWGSSGYYPKEVLERDGPKVFTKGTKMFWNHPTAEEDRQRPERDLKDLAAVLESDARWMDAGPDGPGLYADAKVFESYKGAVDDLAEHIGVSIRALGRAKIGTAEGRQGPIVEAIVGAKSTDFVTDPGRGGKILSLFEAARQQAHSQGAKPKASEVTQQQEANTMALSEQEQKELIESNKKLQESVAALSTQVARLGEVNVIREAKSFASEVLRGVTLPEITRVRLAESLAGNPVVKDGQLDREAFKARIEEAAKAEATYLAQLGGNGAIRGMGESMQESAGGEMKPEDAEKQLAESFKVLGLSESAAQIAAKGR